MAFVAGLPGTGKSLVIRELARMADGRGRAVYMLQWDVARPVFEGAPAGRRYPLVAGVTHVVIRKAAGLWVREAVSSWHREHAGDGALLIGEAPLVGGRFIEVARPAEDAAEPLLAAASCRFVIPVPSRDVRAFIEAERNRRTAQPRHPREREDAPPEVLRALWDEVVSAARTLGLPETPGRGGAIPYDPLLYEAAYRRVLVRRQTDALPLTRLLPTAEGSVYDVGVDTVDIVPSAPEADRAIRAVEAAYRDMGRLAAEAQRWYEPSAP